MKQEVNKLLTQGELEEAAKLVNYSSSKLQKYIELKDKPKQGQEYTDYLDLGCEITKEIQVLSNEMDSISTVHKS